MNSFLPFFTDAVLRGPTVGSMLMCLVAALVGVIVFLRKQSLVGEALSHAAYPGVILGVILAGIFSVDESNEIGIAFLIMGGAFITALTGLWSINQLQRRFKIRMDSALCFILSLFFGIGLTLASKVQISHTAFYRKVQIYLFGQAATMSDAHISIYGLLAFVVIVTIILFYKELQTLLFNREFAKSIGISERLINGIFSLLTVLAIVISIRSVGVILMSAMLIAPAAAARQFTNRLSYMLILSGIFGMVSGFLGNYISVIFSRYSTQHSFEKFVVPTGPTIILIATLICLIALFFAPKRGVLTRTIRAVYFHYKCVCENLLKFLWRQKTTAFSTFQLLEHQQISKYYLNFILFKLRKDGYIQKENGCYTLTEAGNKRAAQVVRLHRLWEVYLVECLGIGVERVHRNAEEMEHILTPELERQLTLLLNDPLHDPHNQVIPKEGGCHHV